MLTAPQLATFKAAILANGTLTALVAAKAHGAIAAYYDVPAASGVVWRPSIPIAEMNAVIVWSEFAGLSVQLQNSYFALIQGGSVDSTSLTLRAGFAFIFDGKVTLTNLIGVASRVPTKFEALFTVNEVCPVFGTRPSVADVVDALR